MLQYACTVDHVVVMKVNMMMLNFNLLQLNLVQTLCDRHRILTENSWMCILNQYHKAIRLKSCTMMCQE